MPAWRSPAPMRRRPGITIYTIHVNTDGDPTSPVLKNCASDHEQVLSPSPRRRQISTVFTTIGIEPVAAAHLEVDSSADLRLEAGRLRRPCIALANLPVNNAENPNVSGTKLSNPDMMT